MGFVSFSGKCKGKGARHGQHTSNGRFKSNMYQNAEAQSLLSGLPLQGSIGQDSQHLNPSSRHAWNSAAERNVCLLERALLGESVACLAKAFSMSKTAVHGGLMEARVHRLTEADVAYIDSDEFRQRNAESVICDTMPDWMRRRSVGFQRACRDILVSCIGCRCLQRSTSSIIFGG